MKILFFLAQFLILPHCCLIKIIAEPITLKHGSKAVTSIVIIEEMDGEALLATAAGEKNIKLWKLSDGTLYKILEQPEKISFLATAFHWKKNLIAAANRRGFVSLLNLQENSLYKKTYDLHINAIEIAQTLTASPCVVCGCSNGEVRVPKVNDDNSFFGGPKIFKYDAYVNAVLSVKIEEKECIVVSGSKDHLEIFAVNDLEVKRTLQCKQWINSIAKIQTGNDLWVIGGSLGKVFIWNMSNPFGQDLKLELSVNSQSPLCVAAAATNAGRFVIGGSDNGVLIWNLRGEHINTLGSNCGEASIITSVVIKEINGMIYIAAGSKDGSVRIWSFYNVIDQYDRDWCTVS